MWEQVRKNQRKTLLFWILTGLVFLGMGYFLVYLFGPFLELQFLISRYIIIVLLVGFWVFFSIISYFFGDKILIKISEARKVDRSVNPRLFNIVEEMKLASGLPEMPAIYIIPSFASNAFATGVRLENSAIIVTAGLLSRLEREELQAVVAHEMAHIANRDIVLQTFLGTLWGSFTIVALMLFIMVFGGRFRRGKGSRKGMAGAAGILVLMRLGGSILSSVLSRTREYLADATAVRMTRNPAALASALYKIKTGKSKLAVANAITAPMYIEAPLRKEISVSTHPPIKTRIDVLKEMTYGAHYEEYQRAYNQVMDGSKSIIPRTVLRKDKQVKIKKEAADPRQHGNSCGQEAEDTSEGTSDFLANELADIDSRYMFLVCRCGLKIKVTADYERQKVACPRCGRLHDAYGKGDINYNSRHFKAINFIRELDELPVKEINELQWDEKGNPYYSFHNKKQRQSFLCKCGSVVQLPPDFSRGSIKCRICELVIDVKTEKETDEFLAKIKIDENKIPYIIKGDSWLRYLCLCGGVIRISSNFKGRFIKCDQCERRIKVKTETEAKQEQERKELTENSKQQQGMETVPEEKNRLTDLDIEKAGDKLIYHKKSSGWDSFACVCENILEISPAFAAKTIKCSQCEREFFIED